MRLTAVVRAPGPKNKMQTLSRAAFLVLLLVISLDLTARVQVPGLDSARVDSLWRVAEESSGKEKLNATIELIYEYADSDNSKALSLASTASELAMALGDSLDLAMTTRLEGQLLRRIGKNNEGIKRLRSALGIAEASGIRNEQLLSSNALALAYVVAGRYDSALRLYFNALRIPIDKDQQKWRAVVLVGIGLLYYKLGENNEAIAFSSRAIEVAEPINEVNLIMNASNNIALSNIMLGNYELAEKLLVEWGRRFTGSADSRRLLEWEFGQGLRLLKIKRYTEALEYLNRSVNRAKQIGDGYYELEGSTCIAMCLAGQGKHREANQLLARCETTAIASGLDASLLKVYEALLGMRGAGQVLEQIVDIQAKYIIVKERVLNENVLHRISVARVEFEENENRNLIAKQSETIALGEEVIDRQRRLNGVSIAFTIVLIGFVILLYRFVRYQRSIARQLDKKVVERTIELQSSQEILFRSLREQRALMELVSRKVQASIATLRGLWHVRDIDTLHQHAADDGFEVTANDLLQVSKIIDRSIDLDSPNDTRLDSSVKSNGKEEFRVH